MLPVDSPTATSRVDIYFYITRATLDMVGLAGFNYSFNALDDQADELAEAYAACMHPPEKPTLKHLLRYHFPILRHILPGNDWIEAMELAQKKLMSTAKGLIEKRKREILQEDAQDEDWSPASPKKTHRGKDLLSLLIKANSEETDETKGYQMMKWLRKSLPS